jgi:regulator of protease activity HflC (stomatin/prohibitin superfamily)
MEERLIKGGNGMAMLVINLCLMILSVALFVISILAMTEASQMLSAAQGAGWVQSNGYLMRVNTGQIQTSMALSVVGIILTALYFSLVGPVLFIGLKVLKPNEALVLTLFGKYYGTLRGPGFFFVNPFVSVVNPAGNRATSGSTEASSSNVTLRVSAGQSLSVGMAVNRKMSLKVMTLNNDQQKINDSLGNPIIIGIAVIWKVVNTARAAFDVDNYVEYLSIQSDAALRNIVRLYPYDVNTPLHTEAKLHEVVPSEVGSSEVGEDAQDALVEATTETGGDEMTLRGSSVEIAGQLKEEIQKRVEVAGLEILEARITRLSYAPEIAAVMLQRQQASAVIAARQMIVDGAVGMVEMALSRLADKQIVDLDNERKAAMVSNLLVVLCSNKETQPVVNSGSIYQ